MFSYILYCMWIWLLSTKLYVRAETTSWICAHLYSTWCVIKIISAVEQNLRHFILLQSSDNSDFKEMRNAYLQVNNRGSRQNILSWNNVKDTDLIKEATYLYLTIRKLKCEVEVLVAQSCPTLCNHMDCSPPGFSVHGTLQARILEWVAIPFSRGSSWPRD